MTSSSETLKGKLLSTDYPLWRNIASTVFFTLTCLGMVGGFIYIYMTNRGLSCYRGFLVFSLIWLVAELIALAYLFRWPAIPAFARDAIKLNIAFANIWFGLFIFSIDSCG